MAGTLAAHVALFDSIKAESPAKLEQVLEGNPAWANQPLGEEHGGLLPLGLCIRMNHAGLCRVLLEAGADINAVDHNTKSPLMLAVYLGNAELASFLLEQGADVNLVTPNGIHGRCAIDYAAKSGDLEMVDLLLENEADVSISRALERALAGDHFDVVEHLLDHGADPNSTHVMFAAAGRAPLPLLEKFIKLGGDVNTQHYYGNVLGHAAKSLEKAELLIRHGAEVNASKKNGHRAIHHAAWVGNVDVARLLVTRGAEVDTRKADGQRAIDMALLRGHLPMVKFLTQAGAAPTVHSLVALNQNKQLEQLLFDQPHAIDTPLPESGGATPAFTAIRFNNIEALSILLEHGADPNSDKHDTPALHFAVSIDNVAAADRLLKHGARVNARLRPDLFVNASMTPLQLAHAGHRNGGYHDVNPEMVALLLKNGADPIRSGEAMVVPNEIGDAFLKKESLWEWFMNSDQQGRRN